MVHPVPALYRRPLIDEIDRIFQRSLGASAAVGLLFLVAVLAAPVREAMVKDVEEVPERFARLILEKPKPKPVPAAPVVTELPVAEATPEKKEAAPPKVEKPKPDPKPAAGTAGKARAETQVAAKLATATRAVDDALAGLKTSLGKTDVTPRAGAARRRGGTLPVARGGSDLASSAKPAQAVGARGTGSALGASLLTVEPIQPGGGGGGGGSRDASGDGGAASSYRTNASLLAVVRKYAPGIEYCYDRELERSPGLRGKLVAALTVAASGEVTDVTIVDDTVGSAGLNQCVLSQIREWRFPAIPEGVVTFRTPFVFTPPKE